MSSNESSEELVRIFLTYSTKSSAYSARRSSKQARKKYHNVAQIVAKHRRPDTIRAFAYPS